MNSFEFEDLAITSALRTQLKTMGWMAVGHGEDCLKEFSRWDLGGGSFPLAANAVRFPLPPLRQAQCGALRDAAPRNAQRGLACGRFSNEKMGWNRIGAEL